MTVVGKRYSIKNGVAYASDDGFSVFAGPTGTFLGEFDTIEESEIAAVEFGVPDSDVIDEARIS